MALSRILAWNYHTFGEVYSVLESNQFGLQHMPNTTLLPATNQSGMEMNLQLCIEKPSHIDVVIVDPGGCQRPSTGYSSQPEMVSPMPRRRLGDFKDFFSKSAKERGFLKFQLISAGGAKRGECRWRLIGDVGGVLQGENATSVLKGALVPLLKFGNKGLQRIGIVRIMVGSPWRRGSSTTFLSWSWLSAGGLCGREGTITRVRRSWWRGQVAHGGLCDVWRLLLGGGK
ncbi:hypothetical protein SLEP1_g24292 [Rubroshorea leprosula]|uniref:Uncharacterized protein n=1 Tax=Rubroshorea leprosula TaxID=152421 RepID=A0AAV5JPP7_9ROSI|nr:hypothetical protein SLEP1_g24292 [Rubroshorea leprosula]